MECDRHLHVTGNQRIRSNTHRVAWIHLAGVHQVASSRCREYGSAALLLCRSTRPLGNYYETGGLAITLFQAQRCNYNRRMRLAPASHLSRQRGEGVSLARPLACRGNCGWGQGGASRPHDSAIQPYIRHHAALCSEFFASNAARTVEG